MTGRVLKSNAWLRASVSALALMSVASCALYPRLQAPIMASHSGTMHTPSAAIDTNTGLPSNMDLLAPAPTQSVAAPEQAAVSATPEQIAQLIPDRQIETTLPPQPLPQFIDTVFGQVLHVPYYSGPGVAQRRELVVMRGPSTVNSRQFFQMAQMALSQYGIAVVIDQGSVRVVQDDVLSGQAPNFVRSRTLPETPGSSRAIVQFFNLTSIDAAPALQLLDGVYPNRGSVRFTAMPETNTIMIMGSSRDVAAADSVLDQIDTPRFAGGQVARIRPIFMSPDQLADAINRAMTAEGYQVTSTTENRQRAITLTPIETAGQLLVFAADKPIFDRALYWAQQLDRAEALGDQPGVFVYTVQNTSAEELGALVAQASPGGGGAPQGNNPPEVAVRRVNGQRVGINGQAPDGSNSGPTSTGAFTIDPGGNRILFHGTATEFAHVRDIMQQLDTPPAQVMVELTVAEVTLTDDTRFGIEWTLDQTITNGTLGATTAGNAARVAGGLGVTATHVFSRGTVQAALSAFASNHHLNILSTPRLVTRSGNEAQITIGTDVPIITSQRAADQQTGGNTDVLQTVQYRQTGVILNVRPVVYGDNRVDIQLYQEVSSQEQNENSAISSPQISNRSVSTQLSMQEGQTAVIGGMIQDNFVRDQQGVPGLKDIPVLGAAFRRDSVNGSKVELVILVTPYIIRSNEDMAELTSNFASAVNRDLSPRGPQTYTLLPWRVPFQGDHTHRLLPAPPPPTIAPTAAPSTTAPTIVTSPAPVTQSAAPADAQPAPPTDTTAPPPAQDQGGPTPLTPSSADTQAVITPVVATSAEAASRPRHARRHRRHTQQTASK